MAGDPLSIALTVGSTILSAVGQMQQGRAEEANARAQAQQLEYVAKQNEVNAGQERAAAQRRSAEARRQTRLKSSRAQALVAAGGGSTLDPSVIDIMGDIAAEGIYQSDLEIYEGEIRARGEETSASLRRYESEMARSAGKQAKKAGYMAAATSVLKGGSSLYDKYGGETIYWSDGTKSTYR